MLITLVACAHVWTRTELFLGADRPDGGVVTDEEFAAFLAEEVTPRFPDGYSVIDGTGYWRGPADDRTEAERAHVVVIYRRGNADAVRAISEAYLRRFGQDAVLRVNVPARVWFDAPP